MRIVDPIGTSAASGKALAARPRSFETPAPIARDWRDVMVVVAGGAGKHSVFIPTFGSTRSVTRRIAD